MDHGPHNFNPLDFDPIKGAIKGRLDERDAAAIALEHEEPIMSFTVRLPVSSVGELQAVANYFGESRTAFASSLLEAAASRAFDELIAQEDERGNGETVREALGAKTHLEDVNGWTTRSVPPMPNGKGK